MLMSCGEWTEFLEGEGVLCEVCENLFHGRCCHGMCLRCSSSVFPFHGTVRDEEFVIYLCEHFHHPVTPTQLD